MFDIEKIVLLQGGELTMTILLPNSKSGLNKLINAVNPRDLTTAKYYLDKVHVHVILPKFKFQTKIKFNDILKQVCSKSLLISALSGLI